MFENRKRFILVVAAILTVGMSSICAVSALSLFLFTDVFDSEVDDYYDAVAEVEELLETSPDHLPARAQTLASEGDAQGLFELVRDEVALTPTSDGVFEDMATHVRWGQRGALRSGQGTFREKADMLARLLDDAGFDVEVVGPYRGDEVTEEAVMNAFFQDMERQVAFGLDEDAADALADRLITEDTRDWVEHDDRPRGIELEEQLWEQAGELTDQLLAMESGPNRRRGYDVESDDGIPLVRLEIDGEQRYLNPGFPEAEFDGVDVDEPLHAVPEAQGLIEINAHLEILVSGSSPRWQQIVEGRWTADELAGRQIAIGSTAVEESAALASKRLGDIEVLTPYMMVNGGDLNAAETEELSAFGDHISIDGQWVGLDEERNQVMRGDQRIAIDDEATVDEVAGIDVEANARTFPDVGLQLRVFDESGSAITGLSGANFYIEEEGEEVGGRLVQNAGRQDRVLFLLDTSGSIPDDFRGEPMVDFSIDIAEQIEETFDDVALGTVRVDRSRYRDNLDPDELWTTDLDTFRQQGEDAISENGGSALWENLADAGRLDPTLIVYINDGRNNGDNHDELLQRVNAGPPALIVGVGPVETDVLQEMADRSGGEYFDAMEADDIAGPLFRYLGRQETHPYKLRYTAPFDGRSERRVSVQLHGADDVEGTTGYTVPDDPDPSPAIVGTRLHLEVGDTSVTRLLAGTDNKTKATNPSEAIRNDVISTFLSPTTLFFEGDAPMPSVWLSDYAQALQTQQDYVKAGVDGDLNGTLEAIGTGFDYLPARAFVANPALPDALSAQARTFAQGMRVSIMRQRVDFGTGLRRTSFDILPTARFATMQRSVDEDDGVDEPTDYELTLRRTSWLALMEAANFGALQKPPELGERGYATWNLLQDQELNALSSSSRIRPRDAFSSDVTGRDDWAPLLSAWLDDWNLFVPTDGSPQAMWVVHDTTGEMYGILADGTGGADSYERVQKTMNELDRTFRILELYTMPANLSPALGVVQSYYLRLAQLYAAVTMVLATMNPDHLDGAIADAIRGLACDTMETVAFLPFSFASDALTIIDGLLAIHTEEASVPSPCAGF